MSMYLKRSGVGSVQLQRTGCAGCGLGAAKTKAELDAIVGQAESWGDEDDVIRRVKALGWSSSELQQLFDRFVSEGINANLHVMMLNLIADTKANENKPWLYRHPYATAGIAASVLGLIVGTVVIVRK
jgi:hypothetical protein